MATWRTQLRSVSNRFWLNPCFTFLYDRVSPTATLGQKGERLAERLLLRKGMLIVDRGYSEKFGEIDLIAVEDRTIVFVEVKTRSSDIAGTPVEAVDDRKQATITRVATAYLKRHGLLDCKSRFDVIAIQLSTAPGKYAILEHIENAFEAVD